MSLTPMGNVVDSDGAFKIEYVDALLGMSLTLTGHLKSNMLTPTGMSLTPTGHLKSNMLTPMGHVIDSNGAFKIKYVDPHGACH